MSSVHKEWRIDMISIPNHLSAIFVGSSAFKCFTRLLQSVGSNWGTDCRTGVSQSLRLSKIFLLVSAIKARRRSPASMSPWMNRTQVGVSDGARSSMQHVLLKGTGGTRENGWCCIFQVSCIHKKVWSSLLALVSSFVGKWCISNCEDSTALPIQDTWSESHLQCRHRFPRASLKVINELISTILGDAWDPLLSLDPLYDTWTCSATNVNLIAGGDASKWLFTALAVDSRAL